MNVREKIDSLNKEKRKKLAEKISDCGAEYGIYPLSPNQYSLWCKYRITQNLNQFTNPCISVSFENVAVKQITDAVQTVFEIQDVLRYRFFELENWAYQYIDSEAVLPLEIKDISSSDNAADELKKLEHDFYVQPFDLISGLADRFLLVKKSETEYDLMMAFHHVICDGGSAGVIINDIRNIIIGKIPEKKARFGTYALEKFSSAGTSDQMKTEKYWNEKIRNTDKFADFPLDFKRTDSEHHYAGIEEFEIKGEVLEKLEKIKTELNCNMYVLMASLFSLILQKFALKKEIIMATTFFNRNSHNYSDIAGDFASICPFLFSSSDDMTMSEYIRKNMSEFLDAMDNSDIVFSRIADEFSESQKDNVNPVYQAAMVYHSQGLLGMKADAWNFRMKFKDLAYEGNVDDFLVDLYAKVTEESDKIVFSLIYNKMLFRKETAENIIDIYGKLLENADSMLNMQLKDISLDTHKSIDVFSETELNAVEEIDMQNRNISVYSLNVERISVIDDYLNSLPPDFFGDVIIQKDEKWYLTGKCGRIRNSGELEINRKRSWITDIAGNVINVKEASADLSEKYGNLNISFVSPDDSHIIMEYNADSNPELSDVRHITGLDISMIYRLCKLRETQLEQHQKNILEVKQKLIHMGFDVSVFQRSGSDVFDIVISGSKALSSDTADDIYSEIRDDRIFIRFTEKNLSEITSEETNNLFVYQKKNKSLTEEKVCDIWEKVLETNDFGIYDRFYEAGGNSVRIYLLANLLEQEFDIKINISDLFIYNTIADLSSFIDKGKNITDLAVSDISILSF